MAIHKRVLETPIVIQMPKAKPAQDLFGYFVAICWPHAQVRDQGAHCDQRECGRHARRLCPEREE